MWSRIHHRFDGPENAPVVVLSNSLASDLSMWDEQVSILTRHFRLLRYDSRGHGLSEVPPGPYRLEELAQDVLDLLDQLGLKRVSFCGLSMGGLVGMWLGVNAADRVQKLVLCNTGAKLGTPETWNARIEQVRAGGMAAVAEATLDRWVTASFRAKAPERVEAIRQMILRTPPAGYIGSCQALRDADLREAIAAIQRPTLVIAGSHDPSTPPELGRFIAAKVPGAKYRELESAHMSAIEAAEEFGKAVGSFLIDA